MAVTDDHREAHANVEEHELGFPDGVAFGEDHMLSPDLTHIPVSRYTSPDFLRREIDAVWKRSWQMACREEEIPDAGDYLEYTIADQEWLVVRQNDGSIKAFGNACRHRGNMIKTGCGNASELRCQYHHWCWDLDGSLKEIPDRHLFITIDDDAYALGEAACDTWAGFVFINPLGDGAPPLREFLGEVADQLDPYHLDRMRPITNISTPLSCNWKVAVEAFLEVYHVQGIHPQLLPMLDDVNTAYELIGPHSRMIVPFGVPSMRLEHVEPAEVFEAYIGESGNAASKASGESYKATGAELFGEGGEIQSIADVRRHAMATVRATGERKGHDYSELTDDQLIDDFHYLIFPGMVFNTHAGGFLLFRVRPHATDPDRCLFDLYRFEWPDEHGDPVEPAPNRRIAEGEISLGTVLDQDFENLPRVQRGLHSDHLDVITVSGQEVRVAHVHTAVDEMLTRFGG